jgi:hypothetical protein
VLLPGARAERAGVNGQPALLTWVGDALVNVIAYQVVDGRIRAIYFIVNPANLALIQRQRTRRAQLH